MPDKVLNRTILQVTGVPRTAAAAVGCVPWYLPRLPHHTVCDPWTGRQFTSRLAGAGDGCDQNCLPDCESINYEPLMTEAKFRPCDSLNLNSSPRCRLTNTTGSLLSWATAARSRYAAAGPLPAYVAGLQSSLREVGKTGITPAEQYEAYERDIAELNIYFGHRVGQGCINLFFYDLIHIHPRIPQISKNVCLGHNFKHRWSAGGLCRSQHPLFCGDHLLVHY